MTAGNIALVGASGKIGSRILDEALARGYRVTGTTRSATNLPKRDGLSVAEVSPADSPALPGTDLAARPPAGARLTPWTVLSGFPSGSRAWCRG